MNERHAKDTCKKIRSTFAAEATIRAEDVANGTFILVQPNLEPSAILRQSKL